MQLQKNNWKAVLILLAAVVLTACDKNRVYEQNTNISQYSWDYKIPLTFSVEITDTISPNNMYINVRNDGTYRFSNLFLFVNTILPQGQHLRDTVEITLASADGQWLGKGLGDIYANRYMFRKNFRFPQKGTYKFELIQAMRVNPLLGIMDAGIRIEKAQ